MFFWAKRLFLAKLVAIFVTFPAHSQPAAGWLTGEEGDFLQFVCSELSDDNLNCDFTQVSLRLKQNPDDIEALLNEQLRGAFEQLKKDGMSEVCQISLPLQNLMEALMRGEEGEAKSYLSQMPEQFRQEFNFADAVSGVASLDVREMDDARAVLTTMSKLCSDPSEDNFKALARLQLEKEARTCKMMINKWSDTFHPISKRVWVLRNDGPEGQCGVQRLDRFECESGSYSCKLITEKRILNPDGDSLLGLSCGDLEERAFRYEHDGDGVYIDCDVVSFF